MKSLTSILRPRADEPASPLSHGGRFSTYALILLSAVALLVAGIIVPLTLGTTPTPGVTVLGESGVTEQAGENSLPTSRPSAGPRVNPSSSAVPGLPPGTSTGTAGPARDPFSGNSAPPPTPRGTGTASDRGITPTTIKLGILLVSFGNANKIGAGVSGYDPDKQRTYFSAYIDAVNAQGGVQGRAITPVYYTVDILDPSTFTAACKSLVDTQKVFAVMNVLGVYGPGILCFTQQKQTPYLSVDGAVSSYYPASRGNLFTLGPSTLATAKNAVDLLISSGELRQRKIGLVNEGEYLAADFDATADYLSAKIGYEVPHVTIAATDTTQAARDIPPAVARMRAAGVQMVLLQTNSLYGQEFASVAAQQGYYPAYAETDFDYEMAGNTFLSGMPDRYFDHAVSISSTTVGDTESGRAETSSAVACRRTYETSQQTTLERTSSAYYAALGGCGLVRLFVEGMRNAGINPTRVLLSRGIQNIGATEYAGIGNTHFRPGQFTAPTAVRRVVANLSCKCWRPVGSAAFTNARYLQ